MRSRAAATAAAAAPAETSDVAAAGRTGVSRTTVTDVLVDVAAPLPAPTLVGVRGAATGGGGAVGPHGWAVAVGAVGAAGRRHSRTVRAPAVAHALAALDVRVAAAAAAVVSAAAKGTATAVGGGGPPASAAPTRRRGGGRVGRGGRSRRHHPAGSHSRVWGPARAGGLVVGALGGWGGKETRATATATVGTTTTATKKER